MLRFVLASTAFASALITAIVPSSAHADPATTAVELGMADLAASDIIQKFKLSASQLLDQANQSGNALLSRGANEADVLARNLDILLSNQQTTLFKNLRPEVRALIVQAELTRQKLTQIADTAYDMKDTTVVDLNALATRFPFVDDKFFIQRVSGLSQMDTPMDPKVRILASHLGVQEGSSAVVTMAIDGKPAPGISVDQSTRGVATIAIPRELLRARFSDSELKLINSEIRFHISRRERFLLFFHRTRTDDYTLPIHLSLYPRTAAVVTVSGKIPVYGWNDVATKTVTIATPDRHCEKNCHGEPTAGWNHIEMVLPGGAPPEKLGYQRFKPTSLRYWCSGNNDGCPFNDAGSHAPVLTDFGTRAFADWRTWGHSTTFTMEGAVQQYMQIGEGDFAMPAQSVRFDGVATVDVPAKATLVKISVRSFTKQEYEMLVDGADQHGLLTTQKISTTNDVDRYAIQAAAPALP